MSNQFIEDRIKDLRRLATERFEEYADVSSEKAFAALQRAFQVYENAFLLQHEHDKKVMIEEIDEKLSALPSDTRIYIREKLKELIKPLK